MHQRQTIVYIHRHCHRSKNSNTSSSSGNPHLFPQNGRFGPHQPRYDHEGLPRTNVRLSLTHSRTHPHQHSLYQHSALSQLFSFQVVHSVDGFRAATPLPSHLIASKSPAPPPFLIGWPRILCPSDSRGRTSPCGCGGTSSYGCPALEVKHRLQTGECQRVKISFACRHHPRGARGWRGRVGVRGWRQRRVRCEELQGAER